MTTASETVVEVAVDELRLGLPLAVVAEVHRMVALHDLPGGPDVIAGTVDVRGSILAVLDLRFRLGRQRRAPRVDDRLVRVTPGPREQPLLVWVDAAHALREVDPATVVPLTAGLSRSAHLAGVTRAPDGLLYLYDVHAFLTQTERADLTAALAATAAMA